VLCFFFSSRRRHTRSDRDWSSDVCSSDLWLGRGTERPGHLPDTERECVLVVVPEGDRVVRSRDRATDGPIGLDGGGRPQYPALEIGRASCRERGPAPWGAVDIKKKKTTHG